MVDDWLPAAASDGEAAATSLYGPIADWATECETNMRGLFEGAGDFNADLGAWDVAEVTTMGQMFAGTDNNPTNTFNADLNAWDVAKVTSMCRRFNMPPRSTAPWTIGTWPKSRPYKGCSRTPTRSTAT
jgi:hypothetical protein